MTKGELMNLVLTEEEQRNCDIALPEDWVKDMLVTTGIDVRPFYVWMYTGEDKVIGKPVSLAELFVIKHGSIVQRYLRSDNVFEKIAQATKPADLNDYIPEKEYQGIFMELLRLESIDSLLLYDSVRKHLEKTFHDRIYKVWDERNAK